MRVCERRGVCTVWRLLLEVGLYIELGEYTPFQPGHETTAALKLMFSLFVGREE